VSLVAVFIPIWRWGLVGRLFREFAVTLSIAIVISMLVSLTATPMLCAHFLKTSAATGQVLRASERGFELMLAGHWRSLAWVLDNRGLMLVVVVDDRDERGPRDPRTKGFFAQTPDRSARCAMIRRVLRIDALVGDRSSVSADPAFPRQRSPRARRRQRVSGLAARPAT
jgi:hypothetical protein